jgi:hypothetical protein
MPPSTGPEGPAHTSADPRPPITPELKVGDFLATYPELEAVLVAQAPAFANLKNPVLRRTVARVATLAQAARVGGVDVRALVRTLREAAGVKDEPVIGAGSSVDVAASAAATDDACPSWYDASHVVSTLDADEWLARGDHPLGEMQRRVQALTCHQIVCLDSGFVPAPLVDAFRRQGLEVATFAHEGRHRTAITALR